MYLGMLMYTYIYIYAHTHTLKTRGFPCQVYILCTGLPLVPVCSFVPHTDVTGSAPHSVLIYPIFSLSSDSLSLAVPPGGCSAQKFLLSWIFTIALQFTFTKINSPTWNFCNQQRDQNKQTGKQSRQRFSSHVNCSLGDGEKNGHHPNRGPCADALLLLRRRSPVYPI